MSASSLAALITAIAGLATAIAGVITALKAHQRITANEKANQL